MQEEIPETDSTDLLNEEYSSPEYFQRKLYFLLEQLKTMHSELPEWVFTIYVFFLSSFS